MDGRQFFLDPQTPLQRRYEAFRAVVVEQQPLPEVAHRFGYAYGTLRNLVAQFQGQCRAEQVPPFLPIRREDDRPVSATAATPRGPQHPRSLIVGCSL
jgi:hypothetical protein